MRTSCWPVRVVCKSACLSLPLRIFLETGVSGLTKGRQSRLGHRGTEELALSNSQYYHTYTREVQKPRVVWQLGSLTVIHLIDLTGLRRASHSHSTDYASRISQCFVACRI
ncbi:hypothetical protein J6590_068034 [Homalodisca vitripennis]|nr:hypothetical protein J6590_068034 [Homalodisca vitripennis]